MSNTSTHLTLQETLTRLESYAKGLSDDELVKLQTEIAKEARVPENIETSVEQIKELGINSIHTDDAFTSTTRAFEKFVADFETEFPETKDFLQQWQVFHKTWKDLLRQSRDFATITSGEYARYDEVYLKFVQEIKTPEDIKDAMMGLTIFSQNTVEGIPSHYAEKFNALGEQIRLFREDFDQYVKKKGVELTEIVRELEEKLKAAEEIVKACDQAIRDIAKYVEFIPIVGYFAEQVTELFMPGTTKKRREAQAEANKLKRELEEVNKPLPDGLAKIQAELAGLFSQFQIVCDGLSIFALTWVYFHGQALELADILRVHEKVEDIPPIFWSKVDLARAISKPLQEGLDAYAQIIALPPN